MSSSLHHQRIFGFSFIDTFCSHFQNKTILCDASWYGMVGTSLLTTTRSSNHRRTDRNDPSETYSPIRAPCGGTDLVTAMSPSGRLLSCPAAPGGGFYYYRCCCTATPVFPQQRRYLRRRAPQRVRNETGQGAAHVDDRPGPHGPGVRPGIGGAPAAGAGAAPRLRGPAQPRQSDITSKSQRHKPTATSSWPTSAWPTLGCAAARSWWTLNANRSVVVAAAARDLLPF